nr:NADH dehydrogenase subunit 2 [Anastatus fulloi]
MKFIFMNFYCYIIFTPMIFISSMMIFSSNSWISMWMIMELNSMSFIMLLIYNKNMKYDIPMNFFLVQSFNSYIFLMSSMNIFYSLNMIILTWFTLITKMGIPPFYLWYLKIMKFINWFNLLILSTIQKIIPLIIMNNIYKFMNKKFMIFFLMNLIIASLVSTILSMNHFSMKIILTYSSIIQMSWIIILSMINEMMMINFFMIYSLISLSMIFTFNKFNINFINNMNLMKFNNNFMFLMLNMSLFSLASIPPFTGFLMKWISIQTFIINLNFWMMILLIFSALISSFIYIRIIFINILNFSYSMKFNFKNINFLNNLNFNIPLYNWMSLILLFIYEIF